MSSCISFGRSRRRIAIEVWYRMKMPSRKYRSQTWDTMRRGSEREKSVMIHL